MSKKRDRVRAISEEEYGEYIQSLKDEKSPSTLKEAAREFCEEIGEKD